MSFVHTICHIKCIGQHKGGLLSLISGIAASAQAVCMRAQLAGETHV